MPIIAAHALTKRFQRPLKTPGLAGALRHVVRPHYEQKTALDAIDLAIEPGEMVGYVGPNGAGKSTTIKLLTGILVPSSGEVRIEGHVPHRSRIAVARRIGVVFGQRAVLALVVAVLAVGVALPASPVAALLFLPSIALGFAIKFLISFLFALLCFWTVNGVGLIWTQTAVVNLFSGALVPLAFFPDWLRTIAAWAPFQGIVATPLAIYQGLAAGWELAGALGLQLLWVALLWALARALWGPATRALDIQGG